MIDVDKYDYANLCGLIKGYRDMTPAERAVIVVHWNGSGTLDYHEVCQLFEAHLKPPREPKPSKPLATPIPPGFISVKQIVEATGCGATTVRRYAQLGKIRGKWIDGRLYLHRSEIEQIAKIKGRRAA
jgi:hypothetical protein